MDHKQQRRHKQEGVLNRLSNTGEDGRDYGGDQQKMCIRDRVPITGFANSVVAPAIEYKAEGQVFGVGCKIFTIAGPVILYGILSSWALGLIYWVGQAIGML